MSRWAYRRLLKSAQNVFRNDNYAVNMARVQLRDEFIKNKKVTDLNELALLMRGVEEVDEMLRFNIVQGTMNERGNFEVKLTEEHQVTVGAGQDDPHGPELAVADPSLLGSAKEIKIEKTKGSGKKAFEPCT